MLIDRDVDPPNILVSGTGQKQRLQLTYYSPKSTRKYADHDIYIHLHRFLYISRAPSGKGRIMKAFLNTIAANDFLRMKVSKGRSVYLSQTISFKFTSKPNMKFFHYRIFISTDTDFLLKKDFGETARKEPEIFTWLVQICSAVDAY